MTPEEEFAAGEAEHFPKGNGHDLAAKSQVDEAMPHLPDGIGLDLEDVRAMLALKHGAIVRIDDPVLMIVTILNAFLGEQEKLNNICLDKQEKLNKRHDEALTKIMVDQLSGVKAIIDGLGQVLAENSVKGIQDIFNSHAQSLNTNTTNAMWCAGIMAVSALVHVAVMALKMWGG